ncbi:hypothetical protein chiPu_0027255, partial [Chiloscyllium punctatum]|nr:hypothetical protein [Chiloscyllium punctatum]
MDGFLQQVADAAAEYETEYRPHYERLRQDLAEAEVKKKEEQLEQLRRDMGDVAVDSSHVHAN